MLACMESFGTTDFRPDLPSITVPALVLHGNGDETVPFEGSGCEPTPRSRSPSWWS